MKTWTAKRYLSASFAFMFSVRILTPSILILAFHNKGLAHKIIAGVSFAENCTLDKDLTSTK